MSNLIGYLVISAIIFLQKNKLVVICLEKYLTIGMIKSILISLIIYTFLIFLNPTTLFAQAGAGDICSPSSSNPCIEGYVCQPSKSDPRTYLCQKDVFGQIKPPDALRNLVNQDPTGAGGLGQFFSNLIRLIYILATVVLLFMIIWGAWDWMTSEGDKEKLQNAQRKIINAIIGIILFAVAFAIIQVLGQFTGFKFFEGQQ